MLVDVHSHYWEYPEHFSDDFKTCRHGARAAMSKWILPCAGTNTPRRRGLATRPIVFGGKAKLSGLWVPDQDVADYVASASGQADRIPLGRSDAARLAGRIAWRAIRISAEGNQAAADVRRVSIRTTAKLRSLMGVRDQARPSGAAAHGHDVRRAGAAGMHAAATARRRGDAVPEVRMILAHLGHPYEGECVVTIRKHPNVYADISALHYRPFQLYHSLMLVQEYGVWDKVLFGTTIRLPLSTRVSTACAG